MVDEKLFGPITIRQFIYIGLGYLICKIIYTELNPSYNLPATIIIGGIILTLVLNAPQIVINEEYILKKKAALPSEKFNSWIEMRKILILTQINMRKEKKMTPDPKLDPMLVYLESQLTQKD